MDQLFLPAAQIGWKGYPSVIILTEPIRVAEEIQALAVKHYISTDLTD